MSETLANTQYAAPFRAVLTSYRSLGPRGFRILMTAVGALTLIPAIAFLSMGAWPVSAFLGLDLALVYGAFKLNYRSGRLHELIELTPAALTVTRVHPSGACESFAFNPYWVRVRVGEWPDGRTDLRLASHGDEFVFGRFLTDDERRDFAQALTRALATARGAVSF